LVDEFPATRSRGLRPREIVIDRQPPFPERIVSRDESEELVRATEGKHILGFTEGQNVVNQELDWDVCDSSPLSGHRVVQCMKVVVISASRRSAALRTQFASFP